MFMCIVSHIYCIKGRVINRCRCLSASNQQTTIRISQWNQQLDLWPALISLYELQTRLTEGQRADTSVYSGAAAGVTGVTLAASIEAHAAGDHYQELILDLHTL